MAAFKEYLDLTRVLYETGIDSDEDVAQAETQLESTQAQDAALGVQRAQFEHAIAMLTGQPASTFSIPIEPLDSTPPAIPVGVPSQLLERRPDIAAAERLMAQANAQIGIARAAYFPTVTLSAAAGLESTSFASWFTWPSRFFSVGPALAESGEAALRLARLSSTTFDSQLDVAGRVAAESPDLYFEIQSLNDYGNESLLALSEAVERVRHAVTTKNAEEFTALMTRGRAYLDVRAAARAG